MRSRSQYTLVAGLVGAFLFAAGGLVQAAAQGVPLSTEDLPLAKDLGVKRGLTVTPAYEGWYPNPDGSYTLYFGYYNRNTEEVVNIPVGPNNNVEGVPGGQNQGQPTKFLPGRHWGVFGVRVPSDFGRKEAVWTLKIHGKTFAIPGGLNPLWKTDAVTGDAMKNFPPKVRFGQNGKEFMGPGADGVVDGPLRTSVGSPVDITVYAQDDGVGESMMGRGDGETPPLDLTWLKQQGPGEVSFSQDSGKIPVDGGQMTTQATFSEAGDYIVRVRVNDASGRVGGGHSQCCWTNGFVKVTVTN